MAGEGLRAMRMMDYFDQGFRRRVGAPAFIAGEQRVSWEAAQARVERVAAAMAARGIAAGMRVGVYSPNDIDAFFAILAAFRLGAVWVPINARNSEKANRHWLALMECRCLFFHPALEAETERLRPALPEDALLVRLDRLEAFEAEAQGPAPLPPHAPDTLASVFPTGGTTGLSKAAEWTLQTWETMLATFWQCMPCETTPVHLVAGPMTHAAGVLAFCCLPGGATNVILPKADPAAILDAIERYRVTHLYLPPTLVYSLLDQPGVRERDYGSLHYLVIAAAPISPARLKEAVEVFGPVVCQSYGQAEAPMFMTFLPSRDLVAGPESRWSSCGRSTLATRLEIMDAAGAMLPDGERGEIVARGNLVTRGYYRDPEATAAARHEGWHRTGDIGVRDEMGFLHIVDRARDMIITGGFNVYSVEVEQVILSHPAVRDCAVFGVPDPKWGEAVNAAVELKEDARAEPEEIIALVKARLGSVHAPKTVTFWAELPRSPVGKVLKREIRDRYWNGRERAVG
ncbi:AMP-binding protein [Sphingomonas sp.]|uniref:class I adenylate-forming enzyme family protein n=1 Tax=Sphingomonas sp. TaxID=28214 RepID=UPI001B0C78EC|nr:AMP-binding protein [Sphingomonas sp.]MBO9711759.1 AMP-binding protein [Sphingomonas sp.]